MSALNRVYRILIVFICMFTLGCSDRYAADKIDPAGNMSRKDYLALRHRGEPQLDGIMPPPIPMLPPAYDMPTTAKVTVPDATSFGKKISISITDKTPLRDVLVQIGREGRFNLEVDPRIEGSIIFSAYDQPFETVLKRICELAGLRYSAEGDFIRIELDEPYQQAYSLDYLSLSRRTNSEVTIATNVFDVDVGGENTTTGRSNNRSGTDNNSIAKISGTADADFWNELEKSLPRVLASSKRTRTLITQDKANNAKQTEETFSLDRQAGLVTVFANSVQQRAVGEYLKKLEEKVSSQVLIEARIIEVELLDEFKSGVNWSTLFRDKFSLAANFGAPGAGAAMTTAASGLFSAGVDTDDFTGILNLVRTFGTARVLSSPRLTVMNNQTAVLKVARNEVYFLTSAQFPTAINANGVATNGNPIFSSTPRTVPVGLVMTVQPSINPDTSRVTMTLRPTISRVVDRVNDPSIGLNAALTESDATIQSQIPVLAVREMDSVLQLQSGEVAVMGGLMQDSSDNSDQGVPPLDELPALGNLAKSRSNEAKTSELVILLRATIIKNAKPHQADEDLYAKYNSDPRPILTNARN